VRQEWLSSITGQEAFVRHHHTAQLRWSDPDMLGHLNHARALSLVEDGRMAFMSESPTVVADQGRSPRGDRP
jgi:acyl-CoA thioesterase FadM